MEPIEYLRALRRRWWLIVGMLLIAPVAGWFSTGPVPATPRARAYEATTVLVNAGSLNIPGVTNMKALATLATLDPVSERVAEELGYEGDPSVLAAMVRAEAIENTGLLTIKATSESAEEAENIANSFAHQFLVFLGERKADTTAREARHLERQRERLSREIAALERAMASAPADEAELLKAERNSKIFHFSSLSQQYLQVLSAGAGDIGLEILQDAFPVPLEEEEGLRPPQSRSARALLGAVVGLFAGLGLALLMERFDTRIRTREAAERHFGLSVLSEIPRMSRTHRGESPIVTATRPTSRTADAFRLLGEVIARSRVRLPAASQRALPPRSTSMAIAERPAAPPSDAMRYLRNIARQTPTSAGRATVSRPLPSLERGAKRVVLVTSPGTQEGKTTVVANLGAAFAELGATVLIMSCDLRNPAVHRLFEVPNQSGLVEALRSREIRVLNGHIKRTSFPGIFVVPTGSLSGHPGFLVSSEAMRRALADARRQADVVILDTPPLLSASDAAHLVGYVDTVLLVVRAGRTTIDEARRVSELLDRLNAPVLGVTLNYAVGIRDGRRRDWALRRAGVA